MIIWLKFFPTNERSFSWIKWSHMIMQTPITVVIMKCWRELFMFYFSWRRYVGFLLICLLHRVYWLAFWWYSSSLILSYKRSRLVKKLILAVRHCFYYLSLLHSIFFIVYFRLHGSEHCRHKVQRADFLVVLFDAPAFKERFNSLVLLVKSVLE